MAIVHRTTLTPSKLELLEVWLPRQEWAQGTGSPTLIGSYRFEDPAGEVGLEGLLVETEIGLLHVPLSYRAAPLEGAEAHLVGTMEHGVLGQRWAYDGEFDPAWRAVTLHAIFAGAQGSDLKVHVDGELTETLDTPIQVRGTGSGEVPLRADLHIVRRVGEMVRGDEKLNAIWATGEGVLAAASRL